MSARPQPLRIAITTGEPAGVGPELTARALADAATRWPDAHFTVLGDAGLIAGRAAAAGVDWGRVTAGGETGHVADAHVADAHVANAHVAVAHRALAAPAEAGKLNPANGRYVLALLDAAIDGALAGKYDAIVTAPLQKSTINDAGVPFTGHTEYLAERTHTPRVVMMLAGTGERPLRVALATTHLPLKDVAAALTIDGLVGTLSIIDRDLRERFGLAAPRILVTGLNPHAGENGYLGREEIDVIEPALERARAAGIDARGPYPADTLFQPRHLEHADCVLAMFHDQGLPVLKYATFGEGINVTLGLPIIRTSVDHGTALDLAGTGRADPGSLVAAIDTAVTMARHQRAG
ncbi:4-hydroxythreonine-4-phosphate dehydrogenase PdxA [Burkholderia thailandensis]|uniref:4-hydroxythreonine-4-phosphate dehydrogenase n=1 Tax=Burkholderia thailandensis (strain ATCC 700388 / DSM 13276 / CCUG 48851 / CIP 106301 / E264) TaxID=271848 RepID=Q2T115_BURTA|nr:4-hydroxythreonine-4-phosphate dehydrogenase PdxA [Burkholderia thailandensis]ABC37845.1 4-hydroxythreonine-4-phosphate dehydrogenase [Burkholderia thailandensis E264]AHI72830.1 4-hydroxythreonine-4-phosphate dehydrogenase [Burkholderia thailandensis 2002721723]AHI79311.1 4-hydroxythreonine-4-phosphate dehydrogenase [Burkholderia thailandensis E444]AIC85957.1 4-hydroxythreonine-4-phosphate dehydrogenase [Burkholderia thailandensis USAMRU Malaysia \